MPQRRAWEARITPNDMMHIMPLRRKPATRCIGRDPGPTSFAFVFAGPPNAAIRCAPKAQENFRKFRRRTVAPTAAMSSVAFGTATALPPFELQVTVVPVTAMVFAAAIKPLVNALVEHIW